MSLSIIGALLGGVVVALVISTTPGFAQGNPVTGVTKETGITKKTKGIATKTNRMDPPKKAK